MIAKLKKLLLKPLKTILQAITFVKVFLSSVAKVALKYFPAIVASSALVAGIVSLGVGLNAGLKADKVESTLSEQVKDKAGIADVKDLQGLVDSVREDITDTEAILSDTASKIDEGKTEATDQINIFQQRLESAKTDLTEIESAIVDLEDVDKVTVDLLNVKTLQIQSDVGGLVVRMNLIQNDLEDYRLANDIVVDGLDSRLTILEDKPRMFVVNYGDLNGGSNMPTNVSATVFEAVLSGYGYNRQNVGFVNPSHGPRLLVSGGSYVIQLNGLTNDTFYQVKVLFIPKAIL